MFCRLNAFALTALCSVLLFGCNNYNPKALDEAVAELVSLCEAAEVQLSANSDYALTEQTLLENAAKFGERLKARKLYLYEGANGPEYARLSIRTADSDEHGVIKIKNNFDTLGGESFPPKCLFSETQGIRQVTGTPEEITAQLCREDDLISCIEISGNLDASETSQSEIDAMTQRLCNLGSKQSCKYSGWENECQSGVGSTCAAIANSYSDRGLERPYHPENYLKYNTRACELGEMDVCYKIAEAHKDGRYGLDRNESEYARRVKAIQQPKLEACDKGDKMICDSLAGDYRFGRLGFEKDKAQAAVYYGKACELGWSYACESRDRMLED